MRQPEGPIRERLADHLADRGYNVLETGMLEVFGRKFEGVRCRRPGRSINGKTTRKREEVIVVLGDLPDDYDTYNGEVCFNLAGSPHEWYVASYVTEASSARPPFYKDHPFGASFVLSPWTLSSPIDQGDVDPFSRFPLTWRPDPVRTR